MTPKSFDHPDRGLPDVTPRSPYLTDYGQVCQNLTLESKEQSDYGQVSPDLTPMIQIWPTMGSSA